VQNSNSLVKRNASSFEQPKPRNMSMLDQFHPCTYDFIENIVDVKLDGNCGYHAIATLLGMAKNSLSFITICLKNLQNGLMSISTCLVA